MGDESVWRNEWGGVTLFSHGTNKERGVMVLVKKGFPLNIYKIYCDINGRYIIIECSYHETKFLLCALYAPNRDSPSFFLNIFCIMDNCVGKRILIGDFNLTLNPEIDHVTSSKLKCNDLSKEIRSQFMEDTLLMDIWREHNPSKIRYSWRQSKPYVASRIDFVLVDQSLGPWVSHTDILPGYKSDHSYIFMEIHNHNVKRGQGIWKFNNRLLAEKEFVSLVNETIVEVGELSSELDSSEKWEMIKIRLTEVSKAYAKEHAENSRLILSQLEQNIEKLTQKIEATSSPRKETQDLLAQSRADLCELIEEQSRLFLEASVGGIMKQENLNIF